MDKESELSRMSHYYEVFMERAYGACQLFDPRLQACTMQNLIMAEKGRTISVDSVAHFEEQLMAMKDYLGIAMDKYLAMPNLTLDFVVALNDFKKEIGRAVSSEELVKIVHRTIDLTVSLNNGVR